jgi:Na+-transporting NADH:ubiquinone oxidoreductase subunit NqrE
MNGDAFVLAAFLEFLILIVVVVAFGRAAQSVVDLAQGKAARAFDGALKVFLIFSTMVGLLVAYWFFVDRKCSLTSPVVLIPLAGQLIGLVILFFAWKRKQRN